MKHCWAEESTSSYTGVKCESFLQLKEVTIIVNIINIKKFIGNVFVKDMKDNNTGQIKNPSSKELTRMDGFI